MFLPRVRSQQGEAKVSGKDPRGVAAGEEQLLLLGLLLLQAARPRRGRAAGGGAGRGGAAGAACGGRGSERAGGRAAEAPGRPGDRPPRRAARSAPPSPASMLSAALLFSPWRGNLGVRVGVCLRTRCSRRRGGPWWRPPGGRGVGREQASRWGTEPELLPSGSPQACYGAPATPTPGKRGSPAAQAGGARRRRRWAASVRAGRGL
ncbi:myosin heavy chain IB [Rhinolophus ferrumequinum]|uniref:myosin heavy chain IB n=1 Tax=Rhinolophus ferrumequinum TaxID=59479 RepID=UPI00140F6352|nr:myosin heavy chain IB [Rhinolophus ferrumequinum]